MTLPDERYRSLRNVRGHLYRLLDLPRITKAELRRTVKAILRHYPTEYEIERIAEACPELLRK